MIKQLVVCLFLIVHIELWAQEEAIPEASGDPTSSIEQTPPEKLKKPMGRVKSTTGVNSESSSFIGDPDNLDPLNPNRDNLKEDEEPVLEDIRQVLNAPAKKPTKAVEASSDNSQAVTPSETSSETVQATESQSAEAAPNEATPTQVDKPRKPKRKARAKLNPDDPDLRLEKKFNEIYRRYNINPTPDDVWAQASGKQNSQKYTVQKGDTLWSISKILFGDPNFWPKLWSLNKQGILNPHFIQPNTFVYFFAGDEENAPTLAVGSDAATIANEGARRNDIAHQAKPTDRPGKIPDSLPLYRNEEYFGEKKNREIIIDLGVFPTFATDYSSEIYLTDKAIKTDVKIQISEISKFRCYEGRLLKDIKYFGGLQTEYDLYEPMDTFKTDSGIMHAYRAYGSAVPYQQKNLKITNCKSLITTDLVIIPKDKINNLKTSKVSRVKRPQLIGGPDVVTQRLFLLNQIVYVDFGSAAYEPGQEYKIQSQVTDEINGSIRIIAKYGSYAVAMVLEVDDVMEVGDSVVLNQMSSAGL